MKLYVTSPTNWTAELTNVLIAAMDDDIIIVDTEARREFAESAAKQMKFKGRIEVG
jgi:hypothetical protein